MFFFYIFDIGEMRQRFKIIYFFMGPWGPQAMIVMGPRTLGMVPPLMLLYNGNFGKKDTSPVSPF